MIDPQETCRSCEHRQRPCAGFCPCTKDGKDWQWHVAASYCPEGRYGVTLKPPGWDEREVPPATSRATDDEIQAGIEADRRTGPCCGG